MKFNFPSPSFHAYAYSQEPPNGNPINRGNLNGSSTPVSLSFNKRPAKSSSTWHQKVLEKFFSMEKNVPRWEPGTLLVDPARGDALLRKLRLYKKDVAKGGFGSISIFINQNGEKLAGKSLLLKEGWTARRIAKAEEAFVRELEVFKIIYKTESAGRHPNLINVYGIANVPDKTGTLKRTILMDAIPGLTGRNTFLALQKCWDAGKISSHDYWGAIQFLGRRLLDVSQHLSKANVVHNDIKPDNFLVNEMTGEPVVIDLGSWSEQGTLVEHGYTWAHASPEVRRAQDVSEKSDVFSIGTSILLGVEGGTINGMRNAPNQGLRYVGPPLPEASEHMSESDAPQSDTPTVLPSEIESSQDMDEEGDTLGAPSSLFHSQETDSTNTDEENTRTYSAKTAYTNFMDRVLQIDESKRLTAKKAKNHDFLNDALLDDAAAKKVLKKVISLAMKEEKKPKEKQWEQAQSNHKASDKYFKQAKTEIKALKAAPNLHTYANLQNCAKSHPELKKYLDKKALANLEQEIQSAITAYASLYIEQAEWFAHAKSVLEEIPSIPVKSGVRLETKANVIDQKHVNALDQSSSKKAPSVASLSAKIGPLIMQKYEKYQAKMTLAPYANTEALQRYINDTEKFLHEANTLTQIEDQETKEKIGQVRERAIVARRMLEIFLPDQSSSETAPSVASLSAEIGPLIMRKYEKFLNHDEDKVKRAQKQKARKASTLLNIPPSQSPSLPAKLRRIMDIPEIQHSAKPNQDHEMPDAT